MTDSNLPITVVDSVGFRSLVAAWKFADVWDRFDVVYEGKPAIPERLHAYTIIASNDPKETYGILLQMSPAVAKDGACVSYTGQKLLAKVRLS